MLLYVICRVTLECVATVRWIFSDIAAAVKHFFNIVSYVLLRYSCLSFLLHKQSKMFHSKTPSNTQQKVPLKR